MDTTNERARRYRARKRGENVPKHKPGPKPGSRQTEEHVAKRKRFGAEHHAWVGDDATVKTGRGRCLRAFPTIPGCIVCGRKAVRHHADGNTRNNDPKNILPLCQKCHMRAHRQMSAYLKKFDPSIQD